MSHDPPSRTYHSDRRTQGAIETRRSILEAATRLFVERGYGRVTVAEIAEEAGTAIPTVYASTGGKSAILNTIVERGMGDPVVDETMDAIGAAVSPEEVIARTARGTRRDNERHHDVIQVMVSASAIDESARQIRVRSDEIYRDTLARSVDRLLELDGLAPGMDRELATGILWFYFGHHAWHLHVADNGRSWDDTEEWLSHQAALAVIGRNR